jgi:hypothetical protein
MIPRKEIAKTALNRELLSKNSPTNGFALFVVAARICLNASIHDKNQVLPVVKWYAFPLFKQPQKKEALEKSGASFFCGRISRYFSCSSIEKAGNGKGAFITSDMRGRAYVFNNRQLENDCFPRLFIVAVLRCVLMMNILFEFSELDS